MVKIFDNAYRAIQLKKAYSKEHSAVREKCSCESL